MVIISKTGRIEACLRDWNFSEKFFVSVLEAVEKEEILVSREMLCTWPKLMFLSDVVKKVEMFSSNIALKRKSKFFLNNERE
jgi:hypothetical protein